MYGQNILCLWVTLCTLSINAINIDFVCYEIRPQTEWLFLSALVICMRTFYSIYWLFVRKLGTRHGPFVAVVQILLKSPSYSHLRIFLLLGSKHNGRHTWWLWFVLELSPSIQSKPARRGEYAGYIAFNL